MDAACARAVKQGALVKYAAATPSYGERLATLIDFAGHPWTLTQMVADVEPKS